MLRALTALACGALLTLALPPTLLWPALLALVPVFVLTANSSRPRQAFSTGFMAGLGFFPLYLLWLPASLSQPDWFGPFFWALYPPLCLLLAVFWGTVTWASRLLGGRGRLTLLLLPAAWVLMEWARTQGYFAFPWGTLGYAWVDAPAGQLARIVGVNGLSLVMLGVTSLLAVPFTGRGRGWWAPAAGTAVLAAAFFGTPLLSPPLPEADRTAVLVQPDLDPFGRIGSPQGDADIQLQLTREAVAALPEPPDVVVWPEGAVLGLLPGSPPFDRLLEDLAALDTRVVIGGRGTSERGSHNSAWVAEDARLSDRYDKNVLVPFGERWPLMETAEPLYRWAFGLMGMGLLENTAGGMKPVALGSLGVYICYESVFPDVTRQLVNDGAEVLVNITNDAWFARGNGARQHYDMGRMRAIETGRYVLRSGLDGITGVVDPTGTSLMELPRGIPGTLTVQYAEISGATPYVSWGHLLPYILLGWLLVGSGARLLGRGSTY